jgi:thioredoxin-like negative regulator of GroEL
MPTIQDGREAIEQGNMQQARLIFEAILQEDKRDQEAWLGLAEVLTNVEDKRICYDNVLKIDKNNRAAKEGLRNLEPQVNPFVAALQPTDEEGRR